MTAPHAHITDTMERLLRSLARDLDQFRFSASDDCGILAAVTYGPDDYPRVVGKHGLMIQTLNRIVRQIGQNMGARIELDLIAPRPNGRPAAIGFQNDPNWAKDATDQLFRDVVALSDSSLLTMITHECLTSTYGIKLPSMSSGQVPAQYIADLRLVFQLVGRTQGRWIEVKEV